MSVQGSGQEATAAGQGAGVVIGGRFRVEPGERLPEFDSPGAPAFAASDSRSSGRRLFALVCERELPPRLDIINAVGRLEQPGLLSPAHWDVAHWPPAGAERFVILFDQPGGGRLARDGDGRFKPMREEQVVRFVIRMLLPVLEDLGDRGITHRAIRLDNLFYRDGAREAVVLGECVSGPPGLYQPTIYETTERGMAAAAGRGPGRPASDLYAFGVLLATLLMGGNPCAGMTDEEILLSKIRLGSYATFLGRARVGLNLLEPLRGLLLDDPRERWTVVDLSMWMDGRSLTPKPSVLHPKAARAFRFGEEEYWNTRTLAYAMARDWPTARQVVQEKDLLEWTRRSLSNGKKAEQLQLSAQPGQGSGGSDGADLAVAKTLMILDPRLPIRLRDFSVSVDGVGPALAIGFRSAEVRKAVSELLLNRLPQFWLDVQDSPRSETAALRQKLDKASDLMARRQPGYGAERCLYELNPGWPCQSPLTGTAVVHEVEELLEAMDRFAGERTPELEPVDAHVAGFCAARLRLVPEQVLDELAPDRDPVARAHGMLSLLAEVQRSVGPTQVPALAGWCAEILEPVIRSFHNKPLQRKLAIRIKEVAARGDLTELVGVIDSEEIRRRDRQGFESARASYERAEHEIAWLEQGGLTNQTQVMNGSQQAATLVSALLSGIGIVLVSLIYAF